MSSLIVWSCSYAGCAGPRFINDAQGQADHQSLRGHVPVPGKPLAWTWDRSVAAA
jgi:hypothetical protein